jgi:hypothetical protein
VTESLRPELDAVMAVLHSTRFLWSTEDDLQRGLDQALRAAGLTVEREHRLDPRNRLDLLVGTVGIEVKVKGDWRDVSRQVVRYCASDAIDSLVLVTCRSDHTRVPIIANAKPIIVHLVGSTL